MNTHGTIGDTIRRLRSERKPGMSQEDAARRVGVTGSMYGKWERSEAIPSPENRLALARLFDVPADTLGYELPEDYTPEPPEWFTRAHEETLTHLQTIIEKLERLESA
jgi:transcriptional regulator with XRE-family HTH domain